MPALLAWEVPEPGGEPVEVRLLGEDLVAFRQSDGCVGLVAARCPHRGASLFWGRNEDYGLRCVYHGWKFDRTGQCVDMPSKPATSQFARWLSLDHALDAAPWLQPHTPWFEAMRAEYSRCEGRGVDVSANFTVIVFLQNFNIKECTARTLAEAWGNVVNFYTGDWRC